jgi:hypothetical protein
MDWYLGQKLILLALASVKRSQAKLAMRAKGKEPVRKINF